MRDPIRLGGGDEIPGETKNGAIAGTSSLPRTSGGCRTRPGRCSTRPLASAGTSSHGSAIDGAALTLCRLRRARGGREGRARVRRRGRPAGPGGVSKPALVWLASRAISYMDESGFPEAVEPWFPESTARRDVEGRGCRLAAYAVAAARAASAEREEGDGGEVGRERVALPRLCPSHDRRAVAEQPRAPSASTAPRSPSEKTCPRVDVASRSRIVRALGIRLVLRLGDAARVDALVLAPELDEDRARSPAAAGTATRRARWRPARLSPSVRTTTSRRSVARREVAQAADRRERVRLVASVASRRSAAAARSRASAAASPRRRRRSRPGRGAEGRGSSSTRCRRDVRERGAEPARERLRAVEAPRRAAPSCASIERVDVDHDPHLGVGPHLEALLLLDDGLRGGEPDEDAARRSAASETRSRRFEGSDRPSVPPHTAGAPADEEDREERDDDAEREQDPERRQEGERHVI